MAFLNKFLIPAMRYTAYRSYSSAGPCFALNDDQKQMQEIARKFAREEIIPVAAHHDKTGEYPWDIVKKAWSIGLLNNHIPQELGGLGLDTFTSCLIAEELAYGCAGIMTAMEVSSIGENPAYLHSNHPNLLVRTIINEDRHPENDTYVDVTARLDQRFLPFNDDEAIHFYEDSLSPWLEDTYYHNPLQRQPDLNNPR